MRILLVSATEMETQEACSKLSQKKQTLRHNWSFLSTGVGMLSSAYHLSKHIWADRPQLVIAAGIAGTFDKSSNLTEVVVVEKDAAGDLGVDEKHGFSDVFDLGLTDKDAFPFKDRWLYAPENLIHMSGLTSTTGVTVNRISTSDESIQRLKTKYEAELETMEGASIHYVCLQERVAFLHLRAISNVVGIRDKSKWKIKESVMNLNSELLRIAGLLEELHEDAIEKLLID